MSDYRFNPSATINFSDLKDYEKIELVQTLRKQREEAVIRSRKARAKKSTKPKAIKKPKFKFASPELEAIFNKLPPEARKMLS
jgi:hypothetical protein